MANLAVALELTGKSDGAVSAVSAVEKALGGLSGAVTGPIGAVGKLTSALGTIGLAAQGIQAIAGAAMGAGQALGVGLASQTENTRAKFAAFIKDGTQLNATLAMVRSEADKTPFSFQAMSDAVSGLIPSATQAKIPLIDLTRQAEILAASHPEQGLQGAAFALREAVSGDFTSIVERFDLPRQTINKLKAEGVPAAEIVSRAMKEMGYDMSLVSNLAATTAGRFSTFQDAIDGLKLKVGQPILAALGEQLDKMSGWLADNSESIGAFASNIGEALAQLVRDGSGAIASLIDFLAPLGPVLQTLGQTAVAMAHGDWANAMNGINTAAQQAIEILDTKFGAVGKILASLASAAYAAIRGDWQGAMTQLGAAAERAISYLDTQFGGVGRILASLGTAAYAAVHGDWSGAMEQLQAAASRAGDFLRDTFGGAITALQAVFSDFAPTGERLGRLFGAIGEAVAAILPYFGDAVTAIGEAAAASDGAETAFQAIVTVVNAVSGAIETVVDWFTKSAGGTYTLAVAVGGLTGLLGLMAVQWAVTAAAAASAAIATGVVTAAQWLLNLALTANPIGLVVVAIGALVGALVWAYNNNETFRNAVDIAWKTIKTVVLTAVEAVQAAIAGLAAWFQSVGGTFSGAASAIGESIWKGMVAGITAGLTWVKNAAINLAKSAINAATEALQPGSPSKVFTELFESVGEGAAAGIENSQDDLIGAVESMLADAREAASDGVDAVVETFGSFGDLIGAQYEKTYTIVEEAENKLAGLRNDAEKKYTRDQELEGIKHGRRLSDLQEELGRATVAQRKGINERIQQEQENFQRKLEDLQSQHGDRMLELEYDNSDLIGQAQQKQSLVYGAALRDVQRGVEDLERDTIKAATAISQKAADARTEAIQSAADAVKDANKKVIDGIAELNARRDETLALRGVKDEFSAGQDVETLKFKTDKEDKDAAQRRLDDLEKLNRDFQRDLSDAEKDEDKDRIRARFARSKDDLEQRYKDTLRDLTRRRAADEQERTFRAQQEKARRVFEDGLAQDALNKQVAKLEKERDERIRTIGEALDEKTRKIDDSERKEIEALKKSSEQKLQDLKEKFLDKVGPLTADALSSFERLFAGIRDRIGEAASAVTGLAGSLANLASAPKAAGAAVAAGGGMRAADGQTFAGQSADVQRLFRDSYGLGAEEAWVAQHNYEIDAGNLGRPPKIVGGVDMGPYNGEAGQSWYSTSEEMGSNADDHRAGGGPALAGRRYIVGEYGPEVLQMGRGGGYVTPNGAGGGMSEADFIRCLVVALQQANLTVGVSDLRTGLQRYKQRNGGLGL